MQSRDRSGLSKRLETTSAVPQSIIVIGEPDQASDTLSLEDAEGELRARLEAKGPFTIEQL